MLSTYAEPVWTSRLLERVAAIVRTLDLPPDVSVNRRVQAAVAFLKANREAR